MGRVTATVLFTDLVGSTELRGQLGEEGADELRRKHDQLLAQAVEANNGRVVKGLGDGIMATFTGASDAVAAAVAIQQAVDRLNRSGKAPVPLEVRVGLSAGDVSFEDEDVHGTPVIEASRLCAAAAGGHILISEVVRLLAGLSDDDVADHGTLELKGLQKPVSAFQVLWKPSAVSMIPMPALLTDVGRIFVGRDAELERLGQLWKEAAAGERRVALLAGEPGVGKTRLAAELAAQVHEEGATVLAGRCDEDLGVPYQPFVEALRHFVHHTPPEELSAGLGRYGGELTRLLPELADHVPDLPPPLKSDPETERFRLFDAVAAWLSAVSSEQPVLLVLDDLQWAAKPTLLLLRHLLRSADLMRLLVVGTYRDTDIGRGHPLVDLLADVRRVMGVERFPLAGLDPPGVAAFLEQAAGHSLDAEGEGLARAVWQETEGNPFFVAEVLRHLSEAGAVERRDGRWVLTANLEDLGIPEGVRDVVGRRLSRLSEDANRVLTCASVVGLEFEPAVIQGAGGFSEDQFLSALEEAVGNRLVVDVRGGRSRFAHALVRATLYDELTAPRRAALHRRVAEAIETVHGGALDDHLPALAHHWARVSAPAADTLKAVDYATRAGDRALAQLAHDEAVMYYRQALELLDVSAASRDDAPRLDLLISLGEAEQRAGSPAHRQTLLEAVRLARTVGDVDALARAALANTRASYWSAAGTVDEDRVHGLQTALEVVPDEISSTRARLLASLGVELIYGGDWERRVELSAEALRIARRLSDPDTLAQVLVRRVLTIWLPETLEERLANTAELLDVVNRTNDPVVAFFAHWLRFRVTFEAGDLPEAEPHLAIARQIAADLSQPTLQWLATWIQVGPALLRGRLDDAERQIDEALELGQATGQPDADVMSISQRFLVRFEQERLAEFEDAISTVCDHYPGLPGFGLFLARIYWETGRPEEARRIFEGFAASSFYLPRDPTWLMFMMAAADLAADLNDVENCRVLAQLLAPYCRLFSVAGGVTHGCTGYYLGRLATTMGCLDDAERQLRYATEVYRRIEAPAWAGRAEVELARLLLLRAERTGIDRARAVLTKQLATARALALPNVERRAVALLQECP